MSGAGVPGVPGIHRWSGFQNLFDLAVLILCLIITNSNSAFAFSSSRIKSTVKSGSKSIARELSGRPREISDQDFEALASDLHFPIDPRKKTCVYSVSELADFESDRAPSSIASPHAQDWACNMFRMHLNSDTKDRCHPPVPTVFGRVIFPKQTIHSDLRYFPFVFLKYRYDIETKPDGYSDVIVRVAFEGTDIQDSVVRSEMEQKFVQAAQHWTENSPTDLKLRFLFRIVERNQGPHFLIKLYPLGESGRKRYNQGFKRSYTYLSIAHEFGHMMGLNDEYDQLHVSLDWGSTDMDRKRCDYKSLMCSSRESRNIPLPYHYYLILRRPYCRT